MIAFMRNKVVGVEPLAEGAFTARGLLDDDIYSLQVEFTVEGPELTLTAVDGRWLRHTTPDCPRALQFLPRALGLAITQPDYAAQVHKVVGRQACRHFANLILECSQAILQARAMLAGELVSQASGQRAGQGGETQADADPGQKEEPRAVLGGDQARYESLAPAPQGFFLDMHVHTFPASPCASASVDDMIKQAKAAGLDGICLTDHNYVWSRGEIEELRRKHDFLILAGNEVTTSQGDILTFGLEEPVEGVVPLGELCRRVNQVGGFLVAAHPFRGFLAVGMDDLGLDPQQVAQRPMFGQVHALEGLNSKVTVNENALSAKVASHLGRPVTGGSDAHQTSEVGIYATRFERVINSEADLVAALHSGQYRAVPFSQAKKVD